MRKHIFIVASMLVSSSLFVGCNCDSTPITTDQIESIEEESETTVYDEQPVITIVDKDGTVLKETTIENGGSVEEELEKVKKESITSHCFESWLGKTKDITTDETITASYDENPVGFAIMANDIQAESGDDDVVVTVYVQGNPGILGALLTVSYDEDEMTLTGAESGSAFSNLKFTPAKELHSGCNFLWDGVEIADDGVEDGAILTLHFDIDTFASDGNYSIVITSAEGNFVDNDLNTVIPEIKNGSITIK